MAAKFIKKTIFLNQEYIDRALKLFNVKTEKEAVNRALEIVVEEESIIEIHKEVAGAGGIEKVF